MTSDLPVIVRKSAWKGLRFRNQQQPDVFVNVPRDENYVGWLKVLFTTFYICDAGDAAVVIRFDPGDACLRDDGEVPGLFGLGDCADGRRTLRIHMAAAAGTVAVIGAAGASFEGFAGDTCGTRKRMPSERSRRSGHLFDVAGPAQRRHGIFALARPLEDVAAIVDLAVDVAGFSGDADRIFNLVVIRFEFLVIEGPIFHGRTLRNAGSAIAADRSAADLEVPWVQAPALGPVMNRSPANGIHHGMDALNGGCRSVRPECRPFGSGLLRARRPGFAGEAEFVGSHVPRAQPGTGVEPDDVDSRLRQRETRYTAGGAETHNDDIGLL